MRSTPARASSSPDCTTCRTSVRCALGLTATRAEPLAPSGAGGFVLFVALAVAARRAHRLRPRREHHAARGVHGQHRPARRGGAADARRPGRARSSSGSRGRRRGHGARGLGDLLGSVYDNAAALHVGDLSMRYVDEAAPLDQEQQDELGPGAWRGTVQLTYRYDGFDSRAARLETAVAFVPRRRTVRIASFGGGGRAHARCGWPSRSASYALRGRWWRWPATRRAATRRWSTTAVRQVAAVLPDWKGRLLVEVPGVARTS